MTPQARKAFLQERTQGIGGSDVASLLSNRIPVEYGCERNLWARLSNIPTDHPDEETEPMALGNLLEPYIATAYADITGRSVTAVGLKKHATKISLQVHLDRLIHPAAGDERTTNGALEIKAVGREMMRRIQDEGLPIDYVIQLNHGMLCHDLTWGAFAVACREDILPIVALDLAARATGDPMPRVRRAKILHFEMERSPEICAAIEDYGPQFWATIGDESKAPPRLEPEDPRCARCVRRIWCQGAALMMGIEPEAGIPIRADLAPLRDEYLTNVTLLEQCESLVHETEKKFKDAMGTQTAIRIPVIVAGRTEFKNVIYRLRKGAERIDGRALAIQYDALRRGAIEADLPGAAVTPPSTQFTRVGMPSRPLLLSALLPKKPKKPGEVPENDEE